MKKIMILGGSEAQLPAILKAKELGYATFNVDMYADAFCRVYADEFEQISTLDYEKLDEAIKRYRPDGIMTLASDRPVPILAKLAEKHHFNAVCVDAAVCATNKLLMRMRFQNKGVSIPKFVKINEFKELQDGLSLVGLPAILKPVDSSGSRGISYIDDTTNLKEAFYYSKASANSDVLLLEEYMLGREFSVESFTINNCTYICAVTEKMTTGKPHFIETGHTIPAQITSEEHKAIEQLVLNAHRALGVNCGPSHTEIMLTKDGPKIVEIGLRMGGDCISSYLVPLATSIDLVGATIQQAVNDEVQLSHNTHQAACIRFLMPDKSRKVIDVVEHSIECDHYFVDKEKMNRTLNSSADRLGYVICKGKDAQDAKNRTEKALLGLEIVYEE